MTVGTPAPTGSSSCNNGTWTVTSNGAGVLTGTAETSTVDQMHFVAIPSTGDIEVVARLVSLSGVARAHAGIAIREHLADGARIVAGYLRLDSCTGCATRGLPDDHLLVGVRTPEGGYETVSEPPIGVTPTETSGQPLWLRLQRVGNDAAVSRSSDGVKWIPVDVASGGAFSSGALYAGFFVAGNGSSATAVFDEVYVGPPRYPMGTSFRTEWVGSSFATDSTRAISRGARSLYVAPNGRVYKSTNGGDLGGYTQAYQNGAIAVSSSFISAKQGALAGDGTSVFIAQCLAGNDLDCRISRFDPDLNVEEAGGDWILDRPGGLAVGNGEVYVSEVATGQIVVLDAQSLAELPGRRFSFPPACGSTPPAGAQPGPIAVDGIGRLWILQPSVDYPIPGNLQIQREPRIRCVTPNGGCCGEIALNKTGGTITSNPAALAYDSAQDRLLIAESGIWSAPTLDGQNIRVFGPIATTPVELTAVGQPGGVYAGSVPGAYVDPAAGGGKRFYVPTGVGVDSSGATYVMSGLNIDIRKFASGQSMPAWSMYGLVEYDNGSFDPGSDGLDFHTITHHLRFDPNATLPGERWQPVSVSFDPRREERHAEHPRKGAIPLLRRFGGGLFMYTSDNSALHVFRFVGEQAFPCGRLTLDRTSHTISLWVDGSGGGALDGNEQPAELSSASEPLVTTQGFVTNSSAGVISIDPDGTIWAASSTNGGLRFRVTGVTNGVPVYSLDTSGANPARKVLSVPAPFLGVDRFFYDQPSDTMYVIGAVPDGGSGACNGTPDGVVWRYLSQNADAGINRQFIELAYARYTNWSTSPACQYVKTAPLPLSSDEFMRRIAFYDGVDSDGGPELQVEGNQGYGYRALAFAGDKLFFTWRSGPIHAVDGPTGDPLTALWAGAELDGFQNWQDIPEGTHAFRRSNGEYLVSAVDSGPHGRAVLFRWPPATGCLPNAPFEAAQPAFTGTTSADALSFAADGLSAYVSGKQGTSYDLYVTTRPNLEAAFGPLTALGGVNSASDDRAPSISPDGLSLYFTRRSGYDDLYVATRATTGDAFGSVQALTALNSPVHDQDAFVAGGQMLLYFASERPNGAQRDLYVSDLNGSLGNVAALGGPVNSGSDEDYHPVVSSDGLTLYFGSTRAGLASDHTGEIFVATRANTSANFGTPTLVPLGSPGIDFPVALSPDSCTLYFASNRDTGLGNTQSFRLYQAKRAAATLATVPVSLRIVGSGSVTTSPFNCATGGFGTCTASGPPGTTVTLQASGVASWSGSCAGNNGNPSSDGVLVYASGGICTVTFP